MYYPDDLVQEVRERSDIVSIISTYVPLQKRGSGYFGCCPFHNEKTPSFSVNANGQFYHCFGCGAGGNVFTFIMQMENMNFVEALKELAGRAGVTLPEAELSPAEKQRMERRNRLLDMNKEAARFFYHRLTKTPLGENARNYLASREVTEEYMRKFGLGYAPIGRDTLYGYLLKKGYTQQEMESARLISVKNGRTYDYFFNRLMFPIFNAQGQTIAFGGRVMGEGEPKYLNSPETEVFNKRRNLYGMQIAKKSRRKEALMVEGYMDVLSLHQAGFDNAVASLGTALTPEQAMLIKRYYNDIVLIYDSDNAGTNAARRGIPILEQAGLKVKVLRIPGAKDPDEYMKKNSAEDFQKLIDNAMDPIEFELLVLNAREGADTADGRVEIVKGMAARLAEIANDLEREIHIQSTAQTLRVDVNSLKREVETIRRNTGILERSPQGRRRDSSVSLPNAQMQLLAVLVKYQALIPEIRKYINPEDFPVKQEESDKDNIYYEVAKYLFGKAERAETVLAADIISQAAEPADQERITKLMTWQVPESVSELEKLLSDTVRSLKSVSIEQKLRTMDNLKELQNVINEKKSLQKLWIRLPETWQPE